MNILLYSEKIHTTEGHVQINKKKTKNNSVCQW